MAGVCRRWSGCRRHRRRAVGGDPGVPARALQRQRDPRLADARLRREAVRLVAGARTLERPGGLQLSADEDVLRRRAAADPGRGHAPEPGDSCSRSSRSRRLRVHAKEFRRLPAHRGGRGARRGTLRGFLGATRDLARACSPAARRRASPAWPRSPGRWGSCTPNVSANYGFAAIIVAFVGRLQSARDPVREPADVAALPGRRAGAAVPRTCRRRSPTCSRECCCSSCSAADVFINYRLRRRKAAVPSSAGAGATG